MQVKVTSQQMACSSLLSLLRWFRSQTSYARFKSKGSSLALKIQVTVHLNESVQRHHSELCAITNFDHFKLYQQLPTAPYSTRCRERVNFSSRLLRHKDVCSLWKLMNNKFINNLNYVDFLRSLCKCTRELKSADSDSEVPSLLSMLKGEEKCKGKHSTIDCLCTMLIVLPESIVHDLAEHNARLRRQQRCFVRHKSGFFHWVEKVRTRCALWPRQGPGFPRELQGSVSRGSHDAFPRLKSCKRLFR